MAHQISEKGAKTHSIEETLKENTFFLAICFSVHK
jgi:hypothetical protein